MASAHDLLVTLASKDPLAFLATFNNTYAALPMALRA